MPTTPEGLPLVSTVQLIWFVEVPEGVHEIEARAGATLARHALAGMPAAVLARAGLEVPA